MMNLRYYSLALLLFIAVTLSLVLSEEIDCAKDCADFVATVVKNEKAALESDLSKCTTQNEALKKEHDETVASLKAELTQLQSHAEKTASLEKELKAQNDSLQKKYSIDLEQQKALLNKAHELAKQSQQEVIEAKMEIANLVESMGSTRINFKLIGEDIVKLWKKIVTKVKSIGDSKSDL